MHLPASQGGINYYGGSFDPDRRLYVVNVNNLAQAIRVVKRADGSYNNEGEFAGLRRLWDPGNDNMPCTATPWGQLVAVNVDTGDVAWRKTLGVTDTFPQGLQETGRPGLGGTILTASGLTFIGATTDRRFRAFETATGKAALDGAAAGLGPGDPLHLSGGRWPPICRGDSHGRRHCRGGPGRRRGGGLCPAQTVTKKP